MPAVPVAIEIVDIEMQPSARAAKLVFGSGLASRIIWLIWWRSFRQHVYKPAYEKLVRVQTRHLFF